MKHRKLFFEWQENGFRNRYRTAISLHSHTLHSRESLSFISRVARNVPLLRALLSRGQEEYRRKNGNGLDLNNAWWTPPLTAFDAWKLERDHIVERLGITGIVSLSDHDDIDGPMGLQVIGECNGTPVSVEWTVPVRDTFLHVGVHNLPVSRARVLMAAMAAYTRRPTAASLRDILVWLHESPEVLIILNHPCWDELGIGAPAHRSAMRDFLATNRQFIHALELNGLRPWRENLDVIDLADEERLSAISGGDRHGLEPNAMLNLTNAATFSEFVDEVRNDAWSDVLVMSHYRENFTWRIIQNMADILATYEGHGLGWTHWRDRVFYRSDEGRVQSLGQLWNTGGPLSVKLFVGVMRLLSVPTMRVALRATWPEEIS